MCIFCFWSTVKYNAPENISLSWSKTKLTLRWGAVENFPAEAEVRYRRIIDADETELWTYVSWVSSVLNIGGFFCFNYHFYINLEFFLLQWMANTTIETSKCELSTILHQVLWFKQDPGNGFGNPLCFCLFASWVFAATANTAMIRDLEKIDRIVRDFCFDHRVLGAKWFSKGIHITP